MNLVEFDDLLCDVEFSEELGVYTDVFLEVVIDHLNDQIEQIKAELEWREEKHGAYEVEE